MKDIRIIAKDNMSHQAEQLSLDDEGLDFGIEDGGPNKRYQMYSKAGNDACEKLVQDIVIAHAKGQIADVANISVLYEKGMAQIAKTFPEVYDTEPRETIGEEIINRISRNSPGWL